jgi:serine/threonine-protein kinase
MERFSGETLQDFLDARPVTVEESVGIVGRLASALEHAHARSIYHRDLKPSNVLVSASLDELRLIDFGLGILVEEAVARSRLTTSAHQFGGAYSAPELLENAKVVGPHLDVYSLGAVWFRLLAGRAPQGTGIDQAIEVCDLHPDLKTLLRRCLSAPADRPSMRDVLNQLRSWHRLHAGVNPGGGKR